MSRQTFDLQAAEIATLSEQEAALRRIAVLVAQAPLPAAVFAAVAEEVARLLPVDSAFVGRYEGDMVTVLAAFSTTGEILPVGIAERAHPRTIGGLVRELRRPVRIDSPPADAVIARGMLGMKSAVGVPLTVAGRLWGLIVAGTDTNAPPPGTEEQLANFTELITTAIVNADSQATLTQVAAEQAALRRVATLVAEGVRPADLFNAVSHEVERVFGLEGDPSAAATVVRFDPGSECVLVGAAREILETPLGMRWQPHDLFVSTRVLRTGRSARVEASEFDSVEGPDADKLRRQGYLSQVGSPIVVDGRLWGAMTVSERETFDPTTEERLEKFTELVATAIANAEARAVVDRLAAERARLLADALAAEQRERRALAEALHDNALQNLLSARHELEEVAEASSHPALERADGAIVETVAQLREAVFELHPYVLEEAGLTAALRSLAQHAAGRAGIALELDLRYESRHPHEQLVFSAAREFLTNVVHHAAATRVLLRLVEKRGGLELVVADDGRGFPPERLAERLADGHVGLASQRVRIEAANGSMDVVTSPGEGTCVVIRFPA